MALLTDRTLAASSAITASTLIHIVDVNDFSQNPEGSSYKANLGQLSSFFSGTSVNIYNSDGNLTGNRTVSQGSFDLDFIGDENSRLKTVYTSTINPLDYGIFETKAFSTGILHNDDTNNTYFGASLFPGNSSMNVGLISTNETAGINFNAYSSSLFHYDGIGTTIEVKADINGVSINQNSGFGYYFPNTYGFSGQVMTTDGAGNTSWQYPVTFTGGSGNCITDLYVKKIHSCSPLFINPLDEGDVYFGSTSAVTVDLSNNRLGIGTSSPSEKLHVSGDTLINSQYVMLSDTINPIPTISNFRGFINIQDYNKQIGYSSLNSNSSGVTGLYLANDLSTLGQIEMYGSNHVRQAFPSVGVNFYRNKMVISTNDTSDGMVIKPKSDDPSATLWFEIDGASNMVLKGDGNAGSGNGFLGLKLNPDGTEMPSSNLQIGGTGTTGTFKYRDGNQQNGYVLTSDANGNASWQPLSSLSGSSVISVTGVTTSAYTATTSYSYYGVEYTGNTNIEIPDATGLNGFTFRIKDERGTASTYPITITPSSGNIDGNPSVTIAINYMSLTLVARNNNWWII